MTGPEDIDRLRRLEADVLLAGSEGDPSPDLLVRYVQGGQLQPDERARVETYMASSQAARDEVTALNAMLRSEPLRETSPSRSGLAVALARLGSLLWNPAFGYGLAAAVLALVVLGRTGILPSRQAAEDSSEPRSGLTTPAELTWRDVDVVADNAATVTTPTSNAGFRLVLPDVAAKPDANVTVRLRSADDRLVVEKHARVDQNGRVSLLVPGEWFRPGAYTIEVDGGPKGSAGAKRNLLVER